jgi:hypothetical protein
MSLRYLLPCKCGQKLAASESLAGTYVTCSCGRSVRVPPRSQLYRLELAPATLGSAPARDEGERGPAEALIAEIVPDDRRACAACGAVMPAGARYCWLCGAKVVPAAKMAPAVASPDADAAPAAKAPTGQPLTGSQATILWLAIAVAAIVGYGAVSALDPLMATIYVIVVVPALVVMFLGAASARASGQPWTPGQAARVGAVTAATSVLTALSVAVIAAIAAAVMFVAAVAAFFAFCAALAGGS